MALRITMAKYLAESFLKFYLSHGYKVLVMSATILKIYLAN